MILPLAKPVTVTHTRNEFEKGWITNAKPSNFNGHDWQYAIRSDKRTQGNKFWWGEQWFDEMDIKEREADMFIKIRHDKVSRDKDGCVIRREMGRDNGYECNRYSNGPEMPEPPATEAKVVILIMESNDGNSITIDFPVNKEDQQTSIFITNNEGKTIDRYIY